MAGLRVSQLPTATSVGSADIFPFSSVSASETRGITAVALAIVLGLLGNSTGSSQPLAPSNGQLWVDTSTNPPLLKVWNGATWTISSFQPGASVATSPGTVAPSSPLLGQLWQDTSQSPDQLKMWDGSNWVRVDPQGITQSAADLRYLQIATAATTYLSLAGGTMTGNLNLVGVPTSTNMAATKGYVDTQISSLPSVETVPSGTVIWTARSTAPSGYLKANGSAISRTTYAALYSAIGTIYGVGDGSTTFNLPDLRGEFIRGLDDGRGIDSSRALGSSQAQGYQSHNHLITDPGHSHSSPDLMVNGGGIEVSPPAGHYIGSGGYIYSNTTGISIQNSGGTETRPRNIALLGCIKI
jgi:hypothetical protein